jgi:hypothetical protein
MDDLIVGSTRQSQELIIKTALGEALTARTRGPVGRAWVSL